MENADGVLERMDKEARQIAEIKYRLADIRFDRRLSDAEKIAKTIRVFNETKSDLEMHVQELELALKHSKKNDPDSYGIEHRKENDPDAYGVIL